MDTAALLESGAVFSHTFNFNTMEKREMQRETRMIMEDGAAFHTLNFNNMTIETYQRATSLYMKIQRHKDYLETMIGDVEQAATKAQKAIAIRRVETQKQIIREAEAEFEKL